MKERFLKKRKEILQQIADLIYDRLQTAKNDNEFDFWMWKGLELNYWCVERDIYLN